MNNERKVMTNEYLAKCDAILVNIRMACKEVCVLGYSWNKACERHGINPLKARSILLNALPNCAKLEPADETLLEDAYDGCWHVYRAVFGDCNMDSRSMPYDYEASVDYVLKTLDSELEDVMRRHFGLKPYDDLQCYQEIAKAHGMTESRARKMLQDALHILRRKKTVEVLVHGLSKYQIMKSNAREEYEMGLVTMMAEHAAMMKKRSEEFGEFMEKLDGSTFDEAVEMLIDRGLIGELKELTIDVLDLSVRAYNALYRNDVCSIYDAIMTDGDELKRLHHIGDKVFYEVEETLLKWTKKNLYGMSPSEMRDIIKKKEVLV